MAESNIVSSPLLAKKPEATAEAFAETSFGSSAVHVGDGAVLKRSSRSSDMVLRDLYVKHGYVANLRQLTDYIEFMKDSCERIDGGSDLRKQLDSIVRAHRLRITDLFPGGSEAICVENAVDKRLLFKRGEYNHVQNSLEPNGSQIFLVYRVSKDNIYNLGPNPSTPTQLNNKGQHWHITRDGRYYYCIDYDVLVWRHEWAYEKYRGVALAMLAVCIGGIETGLDLIDSAPSATKALEHLRRNARLYVQLVQAETDPQNPQSSFEKYALMFQSFLNDYAS